jgi:3',5'-cyclic-AMP phosphodiesterase
MRKNKYRRQWLFTAMAVILIFGGCEIIDFSPNQIILKESERNLNQKNAEKIAALHLKPTDTLRIALISDTQRYYDETEDFVKAVNKLSATIGHRIHFVLHGGDLTDFGLLEEYRWQHQILQKLHMPYLVILGNHDCVANGKEIYRRMFGPFDQTYQFGRNRFILLNTNSLEFSSEVPRIAYLEENLQDAQNYDNAFVIGHVSPDHQDYDRDKELPYARLIRTYQVPISLHGHQHTHRLNYPFNDGKRYLTIGSVANRKYVVLTVIGSKAQYEVIKY